MIKLVRNFWADETGATAIEYGLIAAGIPESLPNY
jgi:Flp pilus assembly pilin Flp